MVNQELEQQRQLSLRIAKLFDEVWASNATHIRKLKELAVLRSSSTSTEFCAAVYRALTPVFNFQSRTASAERIIKFISVFACSRGGEGDLGDEFLECFLRFLLFAAAAANKTARFRACQIVSEIIMRLPDDAEVSSELWDEVIECLKFHVDDKVPAVRTFAVRALARFATDSENEDILDLFLEKLPLEQNGDVRKTIVLSMPPTSATLPVIIDCTLDVNESVRKAAYRVLASKFPLQSLSIKQRTDILQRGLADRSNVVAEECMKLMKDEWLDKSCNGDPIKLLKFLDVETYESVGELVIATLLKAGLVNLQNGQSIQMFGISSGESAEGQCNHSIDLVDAEVALFWRMVCKHFLMEANTKGSNAAMAMGAESEVYAAEATDYNDLLDSILPASVSRYVELVNAHIAAGPNYNFVSRQLLLLGTILDFSDASNRKVASEFVHNLLHISIDHELDDNGNEVVIGDGFHLGGDRDWAAAVAELANKVHAAVGEFEEVVLAVVEELARPCRERTADCKQWLHCLAVIGLLLEKTMSFRHMNGKAIEPAEILLSILLPGAKHANLDVQRASIRCLGLFGLLERSPSESLVRQLRCSFVKGPATISIMASKALLDLAVWHSPDEMDKAMKCNLSSQLRTQKTPATHVEFGAGSVDFDIELLDLLYAGLEHCCSVSVEIEENQSIQGVIGEGLAKILLLSNKFQGSLSSTHHFLLAKLIILYFGDDSEQLQRLKQCLSVFFEHYPSLSSDHKKYLSKAFVPAIRSLWPGVNGNAIGSTMVVSKMRKRAAQASRFMLQMMQTPLVKESTKKDDTEGQNSDVVTDASPDLESGEEGLAIRIAVEVASFPSKKTAAEKSYLSALCRILVLLNFRVPEQGAVKLLRMILNRVIVNLASEKDVTVELHQMAERLQAIIIDKHPEEKLSPEHINIILGRLELELSLDEGGCMEVLATPAARSNRCSRGRRRAKDKEESCSSEDEVSPTSVVVGNGLVSSRSQRASKTAAMSRIMRSAKASSSMRIDEDEDVGSEDEDEDDDPESSN